MAVRFDAAGDELNRTANVPSNSAFTYMLWSVIDLIIPDSSSTFQETSRPFLEKPVSRAN